MKSFITTHKDKLIRAILLTGLVLAVIGAAYAQSVNN